jgi:carbon-monoxide dehydrogenase medium subunit
MKPPSFEYRAPETLEEAVALLAADPAARPIAGGQSLIPVLAFRLATPCMLVDLRRLPGLGDIVVDVDGVRLGAKVRWRDIEDDPRLAVAHPLLRAAVAHVAHYQIRNRGTIGGSLAHADPAAELPGIAVTCGAEIEVVGAAGRRTLLASEFFSGQLMTELRSDEIITELRLPPWPPARRWGFEEFARRQGDFALAGIALYYDEDEQGRAAIRISASLARAPVRIAWRRSKPPSMAGASTKRSYRKPRERLLTRSIHRRICTLMPNTAAPW